MFSFLSFTSLSDMPALAITGSIGSGKSLLLHSLKSLLGAEIYSADEENRKLLDTDHEVKRLILSLFGSSCYRKDGTADRKVLFDIIRSEPEARSALQEILHPRLAAHWKPKAALFRKRSSAFFLAEIPLLFEHQLEVFFDKSIVVGCSDSTRTERLSMARSLNEMEIAAWAGMQESQNTKISKADFILWNDGLPASLHRQTHLLASRLLQQ